MELSCFSHSHSQSYPCLELLPQHLKNELCPPNIIIDYVATESRSGKSFGGDVTEAEAYLFTILDTSAVLFLQFLPAAAGLHLAIFVKVQIRSFCEMAIC